MPLQFVFADNVFDFISKGSQKIADDVLNKLNDEELIRQALEISEELALTVAYEVGYDFSKSYFENYQDIDTDDLRFEHVLLTVISKYNTETYANILSSNSFLRQFEIEKVHQENEKRKQEFKEKHKVVGNYDEEAYEIFDKNMKRILIAKYSDQKNINALERTQSTDVEIAIMLLKMTPAYNSKTGELTSLDNAVSQLITEIPTFKGTDIEKDPIRSGTLLMTEPNYTMQAKLIKTKDGHIISLEEALLYDYKNEDVRKAQNLIEILDQAMDLKKVDRPDRKAQQFVDLINKINNEKELLITN